MKKAYLFLSALVILVFVGMKSDSFAQSDPVMYFCERYANNGEVGIASRFSTGYLTVVVKCDYKLRLTDVHVQFDKWNERTKSYDFYKKFNYTLEPDMSYVYFSKNEDSDMSFDEPGFYRVYLLDDDDRTVASALIEITD
jgi:hypothetical protein